MDTSETYIKMCDCEEIQGERIKEPPWETWQAGDFYYTPAPIQGVVSVHNDASAYGLARSIVWLPRQDQLQEMVLEDEEIPPPIRESQPLHNKIWNMLSKFYVFARELEHQFTSMEQLWLSFVIKEKYSKTWDGEWK